MGIKGVPIPYGAPNASPHVERFNRTLREDALNHFIFLSEEHIRRVVRAFIDYYNGARPSQAIHGIPEPYPELREPPPKEGRLIALPVLGGIQQGVIPMVRHHLPGRRTGRGDRNDKLSHPRAQWADAIPVRRNRCPPTYCFPAAIGSELTSPTCQPRGI